MNDKEGMNPEVGEEQGKKVYAYEITRDGGVNTTYVRADSLEDAQKMAEADLQQRKSADPDADYELNGSPYESDETTMRVQENIDKKIRP